MATDKTRTGFNLSTIPRRKTRSKAIVMRNPIRSSVSAANAQAAKIARECFPSLHRNDPNGGEL